MSNEFTMRRQDAELSQSKALPATATTIYSTALDLGETPSQGALLGDVECEIVAPELETAEIPENETLTYAIQDSADNSSFATIADEVIVQTGSYSSGAEASTKRFRLPTSVRRYIRLAVTGSSGIGDCSGSTGILRLLA